MGRSLRLRIYSGTYSNYNETDNDEGWQRNQDPISYSDGHGEEL